MVGAGALTGAAQKFTSSVILIFSMLRLKFSFRIKQSCSRVQYLSYINLSYCNSHFNACFNFCRSAEQFGRSKGRPVGQSCEKSSCH
jgi:hypothetical protein